MSRRTTTAGPVATGPTAPAPQPGSASSAGSTKNATVAGVSVDYPQTWFAQPNGDSHLALAAQQPDLAADRPSGARLVIDVSSGANTDVAQVLDQLGGPNGSGLQDVINGTSIVVQPQQFQIGGKNGTIVGLEDTAGGTSTISEYIVVPLGGGKALVITAEGPAGQWSTIQPQLEAVLSTIRIQ